MNKSEKEILKEDINELFTIHLNGDTQKFKDAMEEVKRDLEILTDEQIKALRIELNAKLNKGE